MWARNTDNINRIPRTKQPGGKGIYILFDGSMPVYIGKGNIKARVKAEVAAHHMTDAVAILSIFRLRTQTSAVHNIKTLTKPRKKSDKWKVSIKSWVERRK